jgi:hypothetical protein
MQRLFVVLIEIWIVLSSAGLKTRLYRSAEFFFVEAGL